MKNKLKLAAAIFLSSLFPLAAFAQISYIPPPVTTIGGFIGLICSAINWIFTFFIVISVLLFIIGAYAILTAGESSSKRDNSSAITYAIIALIVAILAKGLPLIVGSFLGVSGLRSC
ncbi:MAG: hypothetical protein KGJ89_02790 [Patescibacteria group bacterium]|nr:hypothetical protein [Patescibacteria group bacterium]MDE2015523.1 hypothetical protein [Patescibacteria group bacterium]MDE2226861.1 hypothetical protein [Patescibacteria group bacterium]